MNIDIENQRTGSIYIIRNTVNDKVYIGQTTQKVSRRFNQHMKPSNVKKKYTYKLYNAVSKYGKDIFYYDILESGIPIDKLDEREIFYIEEYDSCNNGYNSTPGGNVRFIYKDIDIEYLKKLADDGLNSKEIAKKFGCNKATILRILHDNGYYFHDDINLEDVKTLFEKGLNNEEIAKTLHTKKWTIARKIELLGLHRRRIRYDKRTDIDLENIKSDYLSGMTVDDICKKHNIDSKTYNLFKKHGFVKFWYAGTK